ncbi:MAG: ADP-forming succinate--CoA ligase subunit beta [Candidatus Dadabacteria bacterium]|nr:ADP-forming succinate--CoA ligase subunit beta [Candidatus Dadabacteria bacterium]MYA47647.1 ADP-forming succinate--CoA ligase subunit beta [Candidatus Dadabacteria bacterium]MYG83168.1 ADP-forming succinate--CoA ligase subunit beta [Candidatus Dadabacteria bacterium]MYK49747.1 ADP-forming succinate--CoA ligase subunit beta [Candidatus Dadabacteria bacterium]
MNVHEYQAKKLLSDFGVRVPGGQVVFSADEVSEVLDTLNSAKYVVKAQIHAGGRGKGGGIKVVDNSHDAMEAADEIIGMNLVTHQTGPEGKKVGSVLIEEASSIEKEFYLGMVIDRSREKVVVMGSPEGGVEIEEVAAKSPEKIIKEHVDISLGIQPYQCRKIAYFMGLEGGAVRQAVSFISSLYRVFIEKDCSLAEINPLVLTSDGNIVALDAKINFDDNALFRHHDIAGLRDRDEEDPLELEASDAGISFVKLDGNIGCLVNGAGLAMATMDIIKHHGGEPANFLDVGGGATTEQVTKAFKMILSDENVKAIFVNIFGGIMKCDTIADGIVEAAGEVGINVPLMVRLEGTNVEAGREILSGSGLDIQTGADMKEAASKVVEAAEAG